MSHPNKSSHQTKTSKEAHVNEQLELGHFNGPEYKTEGDHKRLSSQHERIKSLMRDGQWRTLSEIETHTGDPASSVSAQLRHLRKERFGSWTVERRSRGQRITGLFEYRIFK